MKKRFCAAALAALTLLSGCSAMLERTHTDVQPHTQAVIPAQDGTALEVQSYQELVSVVLHLVSQHSAEGIIRLYNYTGEAEADVERACREVARLEPLGAFAVEEIRWDLSRIVSFYEAQLDITYRRSREETAKIVSVTGSSAIKLQLGQALAGLEESALLHISYYSGSEDSLFTLLQQAYYDTPISAFGLPQTSISIYPESGGTQRIVEFHFTYPDQLDELSRRQQALLLAADALLAEGEMWDAQSLYDLLTATARFQRGEGGGSTDSALVEHAANAEGLALAYKLLCDRAGITCTVVQGTGAAPFWNIVSTASGSRHVDCANLRFGLTDLQLSQWPEYQWSGPYPLCRDGSEL